MLGQCQRSGNTLASILRLLCCCAAHSLEVDVLDLHVDRAAITDCTKVKGGFACDYNDAVSGRFDRYAKSRRDASANGRPRFFKHSPVGGDQHVSWSERESYHSIRPAQV